MLQYNIEVTKHCNFVKNSIFLIYFEKYIFQQCCLKFHKEIPKIGSVRANRVNQLDGEAIRNQNFKRVYLETTFLNLVERFDWNLSVQLACFFNKKNPAWYHKITVSLMKNPHRFFISRVTFKLGCQPTLKIFSSEPLRETWQ